MEKSGDVRKERAASDGLDRCLQGSRPVCVTAGWFEESWNAVISLSPTASFVHSFFFKIVVMWGEVRSVSQVCFTSWRKDNSVALTPSLPLILKHLCLFLSHSSLRPHQHLIVNIVLCRCYPTQSHHRCDFCHWKSVVKLYASLIGTTFMARHYQIWCRGNVLQVCVTSAALQCTI